MTNLLAALVMLFGAFFVFIGFNGGTDIQIGFGGLMMGNAIAIFVLGEIRDALNRLQDGTVQPKPVAL